MKVVFCINSIIGSGGMERVVINRANYLVKYCGYSVYIITTENKCSDYKSKKMFFELDSKVKIIDLGIKYYDTMLSSKKNFISKKIIMELKKYIHRKKLNQKINEIKPEVIVSMGDMSRGILPKIKCASKKILENHFSKENFIGKEKSIVNIYKNYREKKIFAKYDSIIVLTQKDKNEWGNSKIKVLQNSLSFTPKNQARLEEKKVISIGRLSHEKRFDILLKVWSEVIKEYDDWILEIYGEGEMRKQLSKQIFDLKLEKNVFLKGSTKKIEEKLLSSSIYIMTSQIESFGLVLIEAASCGLPLVAFSGSDGPEEIIENGKNGFLCSKMNCEDMSNKIKYLIKNEDIRKEMGKKAREFALEKYSEKKIMTKWIELVN